MPTSAPLSLLSEDPHAQATVSSLLSRGAVVVLPTETVYGLAARLDRPDAVARVFAIKGRPLDRPLSVLVDTVERVVDLWEDGPWSATARALAEAFWPGPLTIVAPARAHVDRRVMGGRDTVGLRCPAHAFTRAVIADAGGAVAAPSANPSDTPSPTTADAVRRTLGAQVDAIVDGGPCIGGVESTIVALDATSWRVVRHGAIPVADLRAHITELTDVNALAATYGTALPRAVYAGEGAILALFERGEAPPKSAPAGADAPPRTSAPFAVLHASTTDALFHQLHAFLGQLDAAQRARTWWQLSALAQADDRLAALVSILSRYLAGEYDAP